MVTSGLNSRWLNVEQALMSLFVLASRDGWVNIMYTGLDAVGVNQQVCISQATLGGREINCRNEIYRDYSN